jgi:ABC-type nitrate/sulfonate/bicarbonate transport system permease component
MARALFDPPAASARLARPEVFTGNLVKDSAANAIAIAVPVVIVLVLWETAVRVGDVPPTILPSVGRIWAALVGMASDGKLLDDLLGTFHRLIKSVLIGAAVGTVLGTCVGYFRIWERVFVVPLNFLLAIPGTALFPLSMIWFGLTEAAIVNILIYEVALTVTVTTWVGAKAVDISLIRAGRALGANGISILWRVMIPAAMPAIISGYRLAFSRAWRIVIIAEMLVSVSAGLGYRLFWAREFFQFDLVYAGLVVVGLSGLLIERVFLRTMEIYTVQRWGTVRELA